MTVFLFGRINLQDFSYDSQFKELQQQHVPTVSIDQQVDPLITQVISQEQADLIKNKAIVLQNPDLQGLSAEAVEIVAPQYQRVSKQLTPKRFAHVLRVTQLADAIGQANNFSTAELQATAKAAILHDIARELDCEAMHALAQPKIACESECHLVLHGKAGRALAQQWGISEDVVLEAIEGHTFGVLPHNRVGMAVYIADVSEPGRNVNEDIRELALENLFLAYKQAVSCKVNYLQSRGKPVHPDTLRVHDEISQLT